MNEYIKIRYSILKKIVFIFMIMFSLLCFSVINKFNIYSIFYVTSTIIDDQAYYTTQVDKKNFNNFEKNKIRIGKSLVSVKSIEEKTLIDSDKYIIVFTINETIRENENVLYLLNDRKNIFNLN